MPLPSRAEGVGERCVSNPAEHFVGATGIGPYFFDVAFAAWSDAVWHLDSRSGFEFVD